MGKGKGKGGEGLLDGDEEEVTLRQWGCWINGKEQ